MGARLHPRKLISHLVMPAGLALVLGGCGSEEELKPDAGVSPFYTGKASSPDSEEHPAVAVRPVSKLDDRGKSQAASPKPGGAAAETGPDLAKAIAANSNGQFSFEELDKINKAAVKLGESGSAAEAAKLFDQVLGAEPHNRLAIFGRAIVGLQLLPTLSEQDQMVEIGRNADLMRTLKKVYNPLQPKELNTYGISLFNEAVILADQKQADSGLAVLKEAVDGGFKDWYKIESIPAFKSLKGDPRFQAIVTQLRSAALKKARESITPRLDLGVNFPYQFRLQAADGKTFSSADFKGKLLLIDIWGTWCGPCRSAIPGLIEMHHKYADQGLAIVGITREHVPPEQAKPLVKEFVEGSKIPYPCVMADDNSEAQIPNFGGYPTTILLDGTGKVRFRSLGAQEGEAEAIENAVLVLLDEMKNQAPAAAKKP